MDILTKFGKTIKQIRLNKKMSQGNLAMLLGVHPSYISGIERGVENMSIKRVERLAKALCVKISDLIN